MKDFNENEAIDTLFQLLNPSNDKKTTITETVKSIEESKKYLKTIYEKGFKDGINQEKSKISKLN
ncbi:hypothetical protein [Empedobacter sp. UBA5637]|uniref:hypothetical protein n=1 Tax=Empedobacter sp. UBA5637 TaxID=1946442 RepID=UPI0025B9BCFA|nr:hypothetical protein [Empedobacter sp. UBA5637]